MAANGQGPILVFGMPRSGTTWLGKILDSDPGTLYRHEPDSYGRMNFLPPAPAVPVSEDLTSAIRAFYAGLPRALDTKISATAPFFRKRYLGPAANAWNVAAAAGAKLLSRTTGELRAPLWLPEGALRRARLVAKSIESVARAGAIARALPEARIVLLLRHPYGFLESTLRGKYGGRFVDSDSVGEDLGLLEGLCDSDVGAAYGLGPGDLREASPAQRLAWQWVLANDKALRDTGDLDNSIAIRYEDLCTDPVSETHGLLRWCGLELSGQTRHFLARSTSTHRNRYYSVFKDPARAANAWRDRLDEATRSAARDIVARSRAGAFFADDL